jgi:hypothetical protein
MAKPLMSDFDFEALRPHLGRLSLDTVELAREILVNGQRQSEVARKHGLTRQRVSGMVSRVLAAENGIPRGWEKMEVWLPPELAAQVKAMAEKARADYAAGASSGRSGASRVPSGKRRRSGR